MDRSSIKLDQPGQFIAMKIWQSDYMLQHTTRYAKILLVICGLFFSCIAPANDSLCLKPGKGGQLLSLAQPGKDDWHKPGVAPIGANILYWIDDDRAWKNTALPKLLKDSGIKTLRFPAGEVADNYDWESNALERPQAWPGEPATLVGRAARTDYLEFLGYAKSIGVEHLFFVVNVDGAFRAPGNLDENLQHYAAKAARWVKAVKASGHKVRYWEIGNESFLASSYPLTAVEYARAVRVFSTAMRAEDPDILIGATGPSQPQATGFADLLTTEQLDKMRANGGKTKTLCPGKEYRECVGMLRSKAVGKDRRMAWWPTLLREAGESFDFADIHRYERVNLSRLGQRPGRFSFSEEPARLKEFLQKAKGRAVPIALTEWNTPEEGKNGFNSTESAHLLNIAIQLGNTLVAGVDFAHYWPLRLNGSNFRPMLGFKADEMTPTARMFGLMGEITEDAQVAQSLPGDGVYVLRSRQVDAESVVIVNTTSASVTVEMSLPSKAVSRVSVIRLLGSANGSVVMPSECSEILPANDSFIISSPPESFSRTRIQRLKPE